MTYERNIAAGLQRAFDHAKEVPLDLASARCVIFSDQHKGQRDGADDFLACEPAYNAALGYYLEQGFTLFVLGDVEELWESRPRKVLRAYPATLQLEAEFRQRDRYVRFWGNHDDDWAAPGPVLRLLGPIFGPGLEVFEALRLSVMDQGRHLGTLFLVHGHQGTTFSDRFRRLARPFVRYLWRPFQRLTRTRLSTPATDFRLRERHDRAMHAWAEAQSTLVLIAGHTHRPVFMSQSLVEQLEREIVTLRGRRATGRDEQLAKLRARLEWARARDTVFPTARSTPAAGKPCYFNSGCCSFSDGDVTGIEIVGGQIRLVRWPNDKGDPELQILASEDLKRVLAAC